MDKASTADEVLYSLGNHIATITLNRPERMNTISRTMLTQLTEYLLASDKDPDVRVVILTGTGRAFCAGLDLTEITRGDNNGIAGGAGQATNLDLRNTPPTVLFNMEKPTVRRRATASTRRSVATFTLRQRARN